MNISKTVSVTSLRLIGQDLSVEPPKGQDYQKMKKQLNQTLMNYSIVPLHLEILFWFYTYNIFTAVCETFVRIPIDMLISIIDSFRRMFGGTRMPHTTLYTCIIIFGFYFTTRQWDIFSVSSLYHSFRGQSSVKLYGAGLALQISEKLLTMLGIHLLSKLYIINRHKASSFPKMWSIDMVLSLLYALFHFYSLYLDFILYTIVLNSQGKNMLMYFFVVNLGKMKAATFKKFQQKNFRKSVIYDAKDRLLKITHSILFIITAWERIQLTDIFQIILVLFYCSVIDHLRHFSSLAMAGRYSQIGTICKEAIKSFQSRNDKIQRCMEWDFTVIPYVLLLLKFYDLAMFAHSSQNNYTFYLSMIWIFLGFYIWFIAPKLHKFLYKKLETIELKFL